MIYENRHLSFDYFALHRECWSLLRKLKSTTGSKYLDGVYPGEDCEQEKNLFMQAVGVLCKAAGDDEACDLVGRKKIRNAKAQLEKEGLECKRILETAVKAFEDWGNEMGFPKQSEVGKPGWR